MIATSMLTLLLLMATPQEETCDRLEAGYHALLRGSFSAERHVTVASKGKIKAREVAWLTYENGTLITDRVHVEASDKKLTPDDGRPDPALEQRFDCRRVVATGADRFVLHAEDGVGELELLWDAERGIVVPLSWRTAETMRSWLRRTEVETTATYGSFVWRD